MFLGVRCKSLLVLRLAVINNLAGFDRVSRPMQGVFNCDYTFDDNADYDCDDDFKYMILMPIPPLPLCLFPSQCTSRQLQQALPGFGRNYIFLFQDQEIAQFSLKTGSLLSNPPYI